MQTEPLPPVVESSARYNRMALLNTAVPPPGAHHYLNCLQ
ncbi:hypothetical protein JCM19301_2664 [Jejuia pallidilutea]|uniref:Uncharacterized protein n=1 Tax=Jejuia pallidilutea TaxID=504487 RepID=A0A090WIJ2_9FLAO|nr:hypothetical protein JCM19301_2664 [Jejuia pallidilutea]